MAAATVTPATPVNTVTEFLYTAGPVSSTITAYRINRDGSLSPAPASSVVAVVATDAPRKLAALGGNLIAAGRTTITVYAVDRETGSLQQTDSAFLNALDDMVLDVPAALIYASSGEEIFAYRVEDGRLQPVMGSPYRVSTALRDGAGLRAESLVLDPARNALEVGFRGNPPGHTSTTILEVMHRNPDGSLEPGLSWPVSPGETPALPSTFAGSAALDATGQFVYMVDADSGQVFAYRFEAGRLRSLSPAAYPAGEHPVAAAVVAPP